jgi:hypothetical protein
VLAAGSRVGPCDMQDSMGEGGMGDVERFWRPIRHLASLRCSGQAENEREAGQRAGVARQNPKRSEGSLC